MELENEKENSDASLESKKGGKSSYNERLLMMTFYNAGYVPSFAVEMMRNKQDLPLQKSKNIVVLCL